MLATVRFSHLILDSPELGSDGEHIVSRVFFSLELDGETLPGLHANIKQTVRAAFEGGPLTVLKPAGYHGPFNHAAFSAASESRYRECIGKSIMMFRVNGAKGVRLRNGTFQVPYETTFEVDPNNHTW
jgi:hypothetical protein